MTRTVVIHQPDFLSWLGFFHRLLHADLFVALDTAQFVTGTSRCWTHRDRIKTAQGVRWLTISVEKAPTGTPINKMKLSQTVDWRRKNLDLIMASYRDAPYLNEVLPHIEQLYSDKTSSLLEFTMRSIRMLMNLFDICIPVVLAGSLDPRGTKNDMLVDILKKLNAARYLSGTGACAYYEEEPFSMAGIEVIWQNFPHPVYPQLHGNFVPALSSIDMLFNCGIVESRRILKET